MGLIVRIFLKDRIYGPSVLYYALPWTGLGLLALVSMLAWYQERHRKWVLTLSAAALLFLLLGWHGHQVRNAPVDQEGVTVLYWNVFRPTEEALLQRAKKILTSEPDIIVLGEAHQLSELGSAFFSSAFPGYNRGGPLDGGFEILVKGEVKKPDFLPLGNGHRMFSATVTCRGHELAIHGVDIHASPLLDKHAIIKKVWHQVQHFHPTVPSIVAGDFNTPLDSTSFALPRSTHHHALEHGYTGSIATWPCPFPMLAIDHIWISTSCKILRAHKAMTMQSDHCLIHCTFSIPEGVVKHPIWQRN